MELEKIKKDLKKKKNEETVIRYARKISKSCREEESTGEVLVLATKLWGGGGEEEQGEE